MTLTALFAAFAVCVAPTDASLGTAAQGVQEPAVRPRDDLDRLRAQLAQPGPDGADERESAIERLLSMTDERAHQLLRERLDQADDPDQVRAAVLRALARRWLNAADPVFGLREQGADLRGRLARTYAQSLAGFWRGDVDADGLLAADPLRELARGCLAKLPAQKAEEGLRAVAANDQAAIELRVAALRAAGDSQNLYFGRLPADFVASPLPALCAAARASLRYLTFEEQPFEKKEQFDAWFARHGTRRYLDLAEEAARKGARRARQQQEQLLELRRTAARDWIAAVIERRPAVDWAAVQARTLVDDPGTLTLCLQQLRSVLAVSTPAEEQPAARQAFARALLQRYRAPAPGEQSARALLLEVAACLSRLAETEPTAEINAELLLQMQSTDEAMRLAALRGVRRLSSPEARAVVVATAIAALAAGPATDAVLSEALQTLAWNHDSAWRAPAEAAPDKSAWLQLLAAVGSADVPKERRSEAMAVAVMPDRDGKRVAEVFDLLRSWARDPAREAAFRTQALIHMQDWRLQEQNADALVRDLTALLADPERDIRRFAAEGLGRLPEANEERKRGWLRLVVETLRERLQTEANAAVLQEMVECLVACGREPGTPETVIGALNHVLDTIGNPVAPEQQFRTEALLAKLPTVAADARADQGQWISAGEMLLRHEKRRSLRHVLESHNAVLLAKDVRATDPSLAERARRAMRLLLMAALLKPAKESWAASEELRREAADVRAVFAALPPATQLPENLQEPRFRLLRLEALVACGKPQEALALANSYLAAVDTQPLDPAQQDAVRLCAAEASLQDGKPAQAADYLAAVSNGEIVEPRTLDLAERMARALTAADAPKAVSWLERVVAATAEDDPLFRGRFVGLLQARVRANPGMRDEVLAQLERHAALFDAANCPEEIKQAVAQLRGLRN